MTISDLSSIYVSGWQCSSTASSTNEPGPDFADYPMDTVPKKCKCMLLCLVWYIDLYVYVYFTHIISYYVRSLTIKSPTNQYR